MGIRDFELDVAPSSCWMARGGRGRDDLFSSRQPGAAINVDAYQTRFISSSGIIASKKAGEWQSFSPPHCNYV